VVEVFPRRIGDRGAGRVFVKFRLIPFPSQQELEKLVEVV
jgi:hypothetical protein